MKDSPSPPASPDYAKLIPMQTAANMQQFNTMLGASRANTTTPFGSSTWSQSAPTFDQAGYDAAMGAWNAQKASQPSAGPSGGGIMLGRIPISADGNIATAGGSSSIGAAPTRDQFMSGGGQWTNTQSLSPEQQALYDKNVGSQLQIADLLSGAAGRVGNTMSSPFDTSSAPGLVGGLAGAGQGIQSSFGDAGGIQRALSDPGALQRSVTARQGLSDIMARLSGLDPRQFDQKAADASYSQASRYMNPAQTQERTTAEGRLAEQGFVPGTPAYNNAMEQIRKTQDLAQGDARDRAVAMGNTVGNQQFGSAIQQIAALLGGQQQGFGQDLAAGQFANNAQNQAFGQGLQSGQFANSAEQQAYNQLLGRGAFANAAQQQGFGQEQAAAQFQNQARQQAIAELLQQRQLPMNELNALRTGTQLTQSNMPATYATPQLQGVDQIGAANQGYQNQIGQYNAQVGSNNASMGMLGSLGAAAMGMPTSSWAAILGALGGSDRRLKRNIQLIGARNGMPLYAFQYLWSPQTYVGHMADEVEKVFPEAIVVHETGFKMVDYRKC